MCAPCASSSRSHVLTWADSHAPRKTRGPVSDIANRRAGRLPSAKGPDPAHAPDRSSTPPTSAPSVASPGSRPRQSWRRTCLHVHDPIRDSVVTGERLTVGERALGFHRREYLAQRMDRRKWITPRVARGHAAQRCAAPGGRRQQTHACISSFKRCRERSHRGRATRLARGCAAPSAGPARASRTDADSSIPRARCGWGCARSMNGHNAGGVRWRAAERSASARRSRTAASPTSGAPCPLARTHGSSAARTASDASVVAWSQFV